MTDTIVKCLECGRMEEGFVKDYLFQGWPSCHNQTMALEATKSDKVEAAVKSINLKKARNGKYQF